MDDAIMIRIVAEADLLGEEHVSRTYSRSPAWLRSARVKIVGSPELRSELDRVRLEVAKSWRVEMARTAIDLARTLRALVSRGEEPPKTLIDAVRVTSAACLQGDALLGGAMPGPTPPRSRMTGKGKLTTPEEGGGGG